ncbi:hypothetical protein T10_13392 [Trichinella papuae]|uniref:Uncharacterized protein n=1 Tax=Trichinella papuae TaxID=268474 RepID=A0A0V1MNU0_9BILA|nr:hypothetical protein T10_13392 [Trichinella papuae]
MTLSICDGMDKDVKSLAFSNPVVIVTPKEKRLNYVTCNDIFQQGLELSEDLLLIGHFIFAICFPMCALLI